MQLENAHEYSLPSVLHWAAADGRAARAAIAIIWMRSIMEEGREDFYGTWLRHGATSSAGTRVVHGVVHAHVLMTEKSMHAPTEHNIIDIIDINNIINNGRTFSENRPCFSLSSLKAPIFRTFLDP